MGPKTRGNYVVDWCKRVECRNRDKECAYCFQFSDYLPPKEKPIGQESKKEKQ